MNEFIRREEFKPNDSIQPTSDCQYCGNTPTTRARSEWNGCRFCRPGSVTKRQELVNKDNINLALVLKEFADETIAKRRAKI